MTLPKIYPQDFIKVEDFKRGYPDAEEHYFEEKMAPKDTPFLEIKVFLRCLVSAKRGAFMVVELGQIAAAKVDHPIEALLCAVTSQVAGKINCGNLVQRTVEQFGAKEVFGLYDDHTERKK